MTNLEFIFEHGRLLIQHKIKPILLERELDWDDEFVDTVEAWDALSMVDKMAFEVGSGKRNFDIDAFVEIYPEYQYVIGEPFFDGEESRIINSEVD